jgi:hypothetical protein
MRALLPPRLLSGNYLSPVVVFPVARLQAVRHSRSCRRFRRLTRSLLFAKNEDSRPWRAALYERTFTASKVGDQWKFQLHTFGGTPVLKKVKRQTAGGKEVEVYAEHYPKTAQESTWEELKPISYDGREEILKQEAAGWTRLAEALKAETDQVQKGVYKTREEAVEAMGQAMRKVFEAMRRERPRR